MKYVIDIDEKYVNNVRSEKIDCMTAHMTYLAVDNATPLDDILKKSESNQSKKEDWISVENELPNIEIPLWVCDADGYVYGDAYYYKTFDGIEKWCDVDGDEIYATIVAWMPYYTPEHYYKVGDSK